MSSSANFDQAYYLSNNADVVLAISQGNFANALDHFNQFGGKELRQPNSGFNPSYYAINNADVLNAVSSGVFANVFSHYSAFGESENRAPNTNLATFDAASYLAANTDVAAAVTAGSFSSALDHFIAFGQAEARTGSGVTEAANPGTSTSLTTSVDNLTGTSGSDNFSGTVGNTDPTIGAGDTIDGGTGTDTFQITATGAAAATVAGVTLTSIETIRVSDTSTAATTVNLAGQSGITTIESFGSANTAGNTLSFTNVSAIAALSLSNSSNAGGLTIGYTSTASSGDTTQAIALSTATGAGEVTIGGVEIFNVTASGNSTLALAASAGTTVNVTATDATTIDLNSATNTSLTTVSAAGSTGAITFTLDHDPTDLSVTGGDGADIFDTAGGAFGTGDVIDGGAGTNTIRVQSAADLLSAAIGATGATISNVDVLELTSTDDGIGGSAADFTVDMDIIDGATSIVLDNNDASFAAVYNLDDLDATEAAAISIQSVADTSGTGNGSTLNLDLADGSGTADSASVTAGVAAGNVITIGDDNGNIENLTVAMNGDVNSSLTLANADFSTGTSASLTVTGGGAGRTMAVAQTTSNLVSDTVNFSGVASDVTATFGAANQTVTGGSGDDTFTFGTNYTSADTIDGGDGNDRLVLDPAATVAVAGTVSNVEELEIGATATVSLNVGNFTIPEIVLQAQNAIANVVTLANADGITDITVTGGAAGGNLDDFNGLTFSGSGFAGTADALTITASTATDSIDTGAFTLAGIEAVTLNVTGDADDQVATFANIQNAGGINTFTVTSTGFTDTNTIQGVVLGIVGDGANGVTSFNASGADTGVSVTLDAMAANSAVTGSGFADIFVLTGSAAGSFSNMGAGNDTVTTSGAGSDVVNGDAGNDTINSAAGADTLSGGEGNDLFVITAAGTDSITTGTGIDTIRISTSTTTAATPDVVGLVVADFTAGSGGDIIDFGAAAGATGAIVADYISTNAGNQETIGLIDASTNETVAAGLTILTNANAVAADGTAANIAIRLNDLNADGTGTTTDILDLANNADDALIAIADAAGNVHIAHIEGDGINIVIAAAEVDVVATLTSTTIGSLTLQNFADFV
jgi:hypothetical protein